MTEDFVFDICRAAVLFAPASLTVLVINDSSGRVVRMDKQLRVTARDKSSANLTFYNYEGTDDATFVLDLVATICKVREDLDEKGSLISLFYRYIRLDVSVEFEVLPVSKYGIQNMQALDFVLGQFATKIDAYESPDKSALVTSAAYDRQPNVVARGLEGSGVVVRNVLRSGGKATGDLIRFLGKTYTATTVGLVKDGQDPPTREVTEEMLAKAKKRKEWAESAHSGARSLTGAALYPVRWTGRKASEWASGGSDKPSKPGPVTQVVMDTVGGVGNGLASVCKGITEAMGEVGEAIGDSAMHHSTVKNGETYAENITKCYVDAASDVGLGMYKVANVASFGLHGIVLDALVEGTVLLVALYDFLIGPVLLQGYMDMVQAPLTTPRRFFVVLRPWSIACYKTAADFCKKPYKIIPTAMLDTIPRLRVRDNLSEVDHPENYLLEDQPFLLTDHGIRTGAPDTLGEVPYL